MCDWLLLDTGLGVGGSSILVLLDLSGDSFSVFAPGLF
jgi:hypothetical protein